MGSPLQRLPTTARRHARRRSSKLMPPINGGRHGHRSSHRAEQTDRLHKIFGSVQAVQCTSSDIFLSNLTLLHGICLLSPWLCLEARRHGLLLGRPGTLPGASMRCRRWPITGIFVPIGRLLCPEEKLSPSSLGVFGSQSPTLS